MRPRSIRAMLEGLRDRFGWAPVLEAGNIIGLEKNGANVSLEPGGQLELSGAPLETIHQTCDEVNEHLAQVRDIADAIGKNIQLIASAAAHKQITVIREGDDGLVAWADPHMLDTILRNLLSNALKFTPRGGDVSVRAEGSDDDRVVIAVCDSGVGIPPDRQARLFEAGGHHSGLGTEDEPGTGLGLLLAHEMAAYQGGAIEVESRLGEGSCFRLMLPAAAP